MLALHASAKPDAPAVLVDRGVGQAASSTSFRELNALVNRAAHGLVALGARPGQRLVWCGPNSLEVLVTIHAARKLPRTESDKLLTRVLRDEHWKGRDSRV